MPHPPERKVGQGFTDCDLTGLLPQIHRLISEKRVWPQIHRLQFTVHSLAHNLRL